MLCGQRPDHKSHGSRDSLVWLKAPGKQRHSYQAGPPQGSEVTSPKLARAGPKDLGSLRSMDKRDLLS